MVILAVIIIIAPTVLLYQLQSMFTRHAKLLLDPFACSLPFGTLYILSSNLLQPRTSDFQIGTEFAILFGIMNQEM